VLMVAGRYIRQMQGILATSTLSLQVRTPVCVCVSVCVSVCLSVRVCVSSVCVCVYVCPQSLYSQFSPSLHLLSPGTRLMTTRVDVHTPQPLDSHQPSTHLSPPRTSLATHVDKGKTKRTSPVSVPHTTDRDMERKAYDNKNDPRFVSSTAHTPLASGREDGSRVYPPRPVLSPPQDGRCVRVRVYIYICASVCMYVCVCVVCVCVQ